MLSLIRILRNHSIDYKVIEERLIIAEDYCIDGKAYRKWIDCPLTIKKLYNWLGY